MDKLAEGKTKDEMRILEVLFNGSSPISSAHTLERYIDSTLRHCDSTLRIVCSAFQNLRLGA